VSAIVSKSLDFTKIGSLENC